MQADFHIRNADHGVPKRLFRQVYAELGLHPVLETDLSHPLRKHIYLEEIPTLLNHLLEDQDEPLVFVACPEQHAQTVVDKTLHVISDWRDAADDPRKQETHTVTDIFLKTDDEEVLATARPILDQYAGVIRLDQALTYGVLRSQSTIPGDPDQ